MAEPNEPVAIYKPDYTVAGGYVPGQVESIGGGYDQNAPGEYKGPVAPSFAGNGAPVTNEPTSLAVTKAKYADPGNIAPDFRGGYYGEQVEPTGGGAPRETPPVLSSMPVEPEPARPSINGKKDVRVKLKVPSSYLIGCARGPNNELVKSGGIVFPYNPSMSVEHKANYSTMPIIHSNYSQYFYKNSQVAEINLTAKFTVQNETEAVIFVGINHLLRALTKMRFGTDSNAGSPPPVCRLMAYGDFMLDNTPVAIGSFKVELPDNVDYFNTGKKYTQYGVTAVPVMSTFNITLIPIYSRDEMLKGTVDKFLKNDQRLRGYL